MKISQSISAGLWAMICLNLLMALGCIGIFSRMSPAIEKIIQSNQNSLAACEQMLATLLQSSEEGVDSLKLREEFVQAVKQADNNITNDAEADATAQIKASFLPAFSGNKEARRKTTQAIMTLGEINRHSMVLADHKAQRLGKAGAWGVVFMGTFVFTLGIIIKRRILSKSVSPLEEIHHVFRDLRSGNAMRRCNGTGLPRDVKAVFDEINDYLDNPPSRTPRL